MPYLAKHECLQLHCHGIALPVYNIFKAIEKKDPAQQKEAYILGSQSNEEGNIKEQVTQSLKVEIKVSKAQIWDTSGQKKTVAPVARNWFDPVWSSCP
ncbi:hypothetical protein C5167_022213 [Papaver somniferum]|uniref:Uncharacterized protein n=1 Tax=Papaver somniferum TaxID=3469 RepID=A0A4Y7JH73_PAPSO|nr:hypothetical protein C5167_022213 [Papaver somniferum]